MTLSIVSPVFNSHKTIYKLIDEIHKSVSILTPDFEIILVDDGSIDNSWQIIEQICIENKFVKGIKLSKNVGQHEAIYIGLQNTISDWIVVLDCDLQDNPAEIPKLYAETITNHKIIMAKRMNRQDSFFKKKTSLYFWETISFLGQTPIHPLVGNFGLYHKDVILKFIASKKTEPYFSIAMQKFDFKRIFVDVEHQARGNDDSSYSIFKLLKHGLNILINTSSINYTKAQKDEALSFNLIEKTIN